MRKRFLVKNGASPCGAHSIDSTHHPPMDAKCGSLPLSINGGWPDG